MKQYRITINGTEYLVGVVEVSPSESAPSITAAPAAPNPGAALSPFAAIRASAVSAAPVSAGSIAAPMPGKVLRVSVKVGQQVNAGDVVCVLEAMKMENEIQAFSPGTVTQVAVAPGDTVATGALLISLG